jgi:twitching motility protein PilT
VMIGTPPIQNMIRESKIFQIPSIIQTSRKQGMNLMNDALLDLVRKKIVEPRDAYSKAVDKTALASMFTANGIEMA